MSHALGTETALLSRSFADGAHMYARRSTHSLASAAFEHMCKTGCVCACVRVEVPDVFEKVTPDTALWEEQAQSAGLLSHPVGMNEACVRAQVPSHATCNPPPPCAGMMEVPFPSEECQSPISPGESAVRFLEHLFVPLLVWIWDRVVLSKAPWRFASLQMWVPQAPQSRWI